MDPTGNVHQLAYPTLIGATFASLDLAWDVYNRGYYASREETVIRVSSGAISGATIGLYFGGLPLTGIKEFAFTYSSSELTNIPVEKILKEITGVEYEKGPTMVESGAGWIYENCEYCKGVYDSTVDFINDYNQQHESKNQQTNEKYSSGEYSGTTVRTKEQGNIHYDTFYSYYVEMGWIDSEEE